jgi:hypothetical protein
MLGRCTCEGLAPIQGKNTVVGATETRIMESVRLSATVSHDIRTRLASLASLGTFVTVQASDTLYGMLIVEVRIYRNINF